MSKINLNNYEAYWLDYIEGNLSSEDQADFLLFVAQHPELDIDLEDELTSLPSYTALTLSADEKNALKETAELEELVVLDLDQELNDKTKLAALRSKHAQIYDALKSDYARTRLMPATFVFENKSDLKQTTIIPIYLRIAVAASIIGFIALILPWNSLSEPNIVAKEPSPKSSIKIESLATFNYNATVQKKDFNFKKDPKQSFVVENPNFSIVEENPAEKDTSSSELKQELPIINEEIYLALDSTLKDVNLKDNDIVIETDTTSLETNISEEIALNSTLKNLTVPEFLADKVLHVQKNDEEPLIASIIDQKTNWEVDYQESESSDKKITQFKVGKFEFYKSSNK